MPHHLNTDDTNAHSYAYTVDDVAKMIALVLTFAHDHPSAIISHKREHLAQRAEGIARTFDDATDANDAWDLDDVATGMRRAVG